MYFLFVHIFLPLMDDNARGVFLYALSVDVVVGRILIWTVNFQYIFDSRVGGDDFKGCSTVLVVVDI